MQCYKCNIACNKYVTNISLLFKKKGFAEHNSKSIKKKELELENVFTMCSPATSRMIFQKLTINATNIFQKKKKMYERVCVKVPYKDLALKINFWIKW